MEDKFYETNEGHKILDESCWTDNLRKYRELENKYLLENIEPKETLLDVGCGLGRHLVLLKNKIKKLVGIDHSKTIFKQVNELFEILNIHVNHVDILDFDSEEKFDYIICMFNTFGNMNTETQKVFLEKVKKFLKQDGKLIISVYSENAKDDQIQFYKNLGLGVEGFDEDFVHTNQGFASERFSKEKITKIIESINELKVKNIRSLNKISYVLEII